MREAASRRPTRLVRVIERNPIVALRRRSGYGRSTLAIEVAEALNLTLVRIVVPDPSDGLTSLLDEVQHALEAADVHGTATTRCLHQRSGRLDCLALRDDWWRIAASSTRWDASTPRKRS